MPTDRVTKSLLAVIAGLLGVIAVRSGSFPETTAALAQPAPAGAPAPAPANVQLTASGNSFMLFDPSTGEVLQPTWDAKDGTGLVSLGTVRKNAAGKWVFAWAAAGNAAGAPVPAPAPKVPNPVEPAEPADPAKAALTTKAQADLATIMAALGAFRLDTGRYPSTEEGLHSLVVQPSAVENWKGPYVKPSVPMDPWGNPYVYHFPGRADARRPDLLSFGPDRKEGGADDLIGTAGPAK
jgi:type II secretion system protein G